LIDLLPYILLQKYIYILASEMASPGNQHRASCIGTFVPYSTRTKLNWPAAGRTSYTALSLVTRVSVTTWLAAAKQGRLVLGKFVRWEHWSTRAQFELEFEFSSVQFLCSEQAF